MKEKVVIVNYNCGNIGSIANMLDYLGVESLVSSEKSEILGASHLILPGVGSFDHGVRELNKLDLAGTIREYALTLKRPILGICLGAQLMTVKSEEGKLEGLGFFDADTIKFESNKGLKLPHMGWNSVNLLKSDGIVCNNTREPWRFYFVHKYYMKSRVLDNVLCETNYGGLFHSALSRDNITAVQFHPEKSHDYGMRLFKNFIQKK